MVLISFWKESGWGEGGGGRSGVGGGDGGPSITPETMKLMFRFQI